MDGTLTEAKARADAKPALTQDHATGTAAAHVARDRAALLAHAAGCAADSLVFHRFAPTVSLGAHQTRSREVRDSHCTAAGIAVVRRPTAGGALYLDPGQFCFSLLLPSADLGHSVADRLATAAALVAAALRQLGVDTGFKAPNDLQVADRQKIASVFLADHDGSTLIFASILAELDLRAAMQALLVPTEKLTVTGLEHAKDRMTSLADLLGRVPTQAELVAATRAGLAEILHRTFPPATPGLPATVADAPETCDWTLDGNRFETKDKVAGATLRLLLDLDATDRVRHLRFATDGHFTPSDTLTRLAAALTGLPARDLAHEAETWFATQTIDTAGFTAADIVRLIERAASKWLMQSSLGLTPAQTSGLMLAGNSRDPEQALANASVMLVPYCAKPNWCKWRHTIDCVECGKCEVGDAYMLARERNMDVVTITNFEHLAETLAEMKGAGVSSYVGMCCGEFFLKRHHAFRDSGMDGVLLDIEGATCYELKEEHLAYAGAFSAEAALDIDAVRKVMAKVPVVPAGGRACLSGAAPYRAPRHGSATGCADCACGSTATTTAAQGL